jgi:hypothetical protein
MRRPLLTLLLALGAGAAHADNGLLYVGAGIAYDNLKDITATNSDLNSTNWKAWAGVRPIGLFAIEVDYIDLGTLSATYQGGSTNLRYKAYTGYAVGYLPIPLPYLDVFGKVGVARWFSSGGATFTGPGTGFFFSMSDDGVKLAWGAGGQLHIGNFGARLEYESFNIRNLNSANLISLTAFVNLF